MTLELKEKNLKTENKKRQLNENISDLDNKLRNKAVQIKNNASLYNYPTYQINTIKKDISSNPTIIDEEYSFHLQKLLKEDIKASINSLQNVVTNFSAYFLSAITILKKEIIPTQPLIDLINDNILQAWVRQGIDLHKGVRDECAFCGNIIKPDLWNKLDAHFSKESEELRVSILDLINHIKEEQVNISNISCPKKERFYINLHSEYEKLNNEWNLAVNKFSENCNFIIKNLIIKEKNIFTKYEISEIEDITFDINVLIKMFNDLINLNNEKANSIVEEQDNARYKLRLSEVAKYAKDIDYLEKNSDIDLLQEEVNSLIEERNVIEETLKYYIEEKRKLEAATKDESRGAELVNQHLSHFFGHQELKLVAEGESPNIKFNIIRNNTYATNLSEGESSLISFCYFIAKIEDELKINLITQSLIIYIDDPISSLDNNHIFFMYSLIEAIIAKPKNYAQLFISTHNLDFLKYLRKLTIPDKYKFSPGGKDISGLANFILERKNKSKVQLIISPIYLRNYITEFNYLFDQIYKCSISDEVSISHDYQYNFGNNMRKFLEAYLFYKYPTHNFNFEKRLSNFFANDQISISLVNRVINEYSHLGDNFERGLEPIDSESIILISKAVLDRIKIIDQSQYEALIDSIMIDNL